MDFDKNGYGNEIGKKNTNMANKEGLNGNCKQILAETNHK